MLIFPDVKSIEKSAGVEEKFWPEVPKKQAPIYSRIEDIGGDVKDVAFDIAKWIGSTSAAKGVWNALNTVFTADWATKLFHSDSFEDNAFWLRDKREELDKLTNEPERIFKQNIINAVDYFKIDTKNYPKYTTALKTYQSFIEPTLEKPKELTTSAYKLFQNKERLLKDYVFSQKNKEELTNWDWKPIVPEKLEWIIKDGNNFFNDLVTGFNNYEKSDTGIKNYQEWFDWFVEDLKISDPVLFDRYDKYLLDSNKYSRPVKFDGWEWAQKGSNVLTEMFAGTKEGGRYADIGRAAEAAKQGEDILWAIQEPEKIHWDKPSYLVNFNRELIHNRLEWLDELTDAKAFWLLWSSLIEKGKNLDDDLAVWIAASLSWEVFWKVAVWTVKAIPKIVKYAKKVEKMNDRIKEFERVSDTVKSLKGVQEVYWLSKKIADSGVARFVGHNAMNGLATDAILMEYYTGDYSAGDFLINSIFNVWFDALSIRRMGKINKESVDVFEKEVWEYTMKMRESMNVPWGETASSELEAVLAKRYEVNKDLINKYLKSTSEKERANIAKQIGKQIVDKKMVNDVVFSLKAERDLLIKIKWLDLKPAVKERVEAKIVGMLYDDNKLTAFWYDKAWLTKEFFISNDPTSVKLRKNILNKRIDDLNTAIKWAEDKGVEELQKVVTPEFLQSILSGNKDKSHKMLLLSQLADADSEIFKNLVVANLLKNDDSVRKVLGQEAIPMSKDKPIIFPVDGRPWTIRMSTDVSELVDKWTDITERNKTKFLQETGHLEVNSQTPVLTMGKDGKVEATNGTILHNILSNFLKKFDRLKRVETREKKLLLLRKLNELGDINSKDGKQLMEDIYKLDVNTVTARELKRAEDWKKILNADQQFTKLVKDFVKKDGEKYTLSKSNALDFFEKYNELIVREKMSVENTMAGIIEWMEKIKKSYPRLIKGIEDKWSKAKAVMEKTLAGKEDMGIVKARIDKAVRPTLGKLVVKKRQVKKVKKWKKIKHFTKEENVEKILNEWFDTEKLPIHWTKWLEKGEATGRLWGKDVLYFTTDENRWNKATIYVWEWKWNIDRPFYNYETQKWDVEKNAYIKEDLKPVEASIKDNAKVLVVDNLDDTINLVKNSWVQFDKYNFTEQAIEYAKSKGYDIVNFKDKKWGWTSKIFGTDKYWKNEWYDQLLGKSGNDDYFVLNKNAINIEWLVKTETPTPKKQPTWIEVDIAKAKSDKFFKIKQLAKEIDTYWKPKDWILTHYDLWKFKDKDIIILETRFQKELEVLESYKKDKQRSGDNLIDDFKNVPPMKKSNTDLFKKEWTNKPTKIQEVKFIEKAVSQKEYENIIKNWYIKSDSSLNLSAQQWQTLFHNEWVWTAFYLPQEWGYIIKVKVKPAHKISINEVWEIFTKEKISINDITEIQGWEWIYKINKKAKEDIAEMQSAKGGKKQTLEIKDDDIQDIIWLRDEERMWGGRAYAEEHRKAMHEVFGEGISLEENPSVLQPFIYQSKKYLEEDMSETAKKEVREAAEKFTNGETTLEVASQEASLAIHKENFVRGLTEKIEENKWTINKKFISDVTEEYSKTLDEVQNVFGGNIGRWPIGKFTKGVRTTRQILDNPLFHTYFKARDALMGHLNHLYTNPVVGTLSKRYKWFFIFDTKKNKVSLATVIDFLNAEWSPSNKDEIMELLNKNFKLGKDESNITKALGEAWTLFEPDINPSKIKTAGEDLYDLSMLVKEFTDWLNDSAEKAIWFTFPIYRMVNNSSIEKQLLWLNGKMLDELANNTITFKGKVAGKDTIIRGKKALAEFYKDSKFGIKLWPIGGDRRAKFVNNVWRDLTGQAITDIPDSLKAILYARVIFWFKMSLSKGTTMMAQDGANIALSMKGLYNLDWAFWKKDVEATTWLLNRFWLKDVAMPVSDQWLLFDLVRWDMSVMDSLSGVADWLATPLKKMGVIKWDKITIPSLIEIPKLVGKPLKWLSKEAGKVKWGKKVSSLLNFVWEEISTGIVPVEKLAKVYVRSMKYTTIMNILEQQWWGTATQIKRKLLAGNISENVVKDAVLEANNRAYTLITNVVWYSATDTTIRNQWSRWMLHNNLTAWFSRQAGNFVDKVMVPFERGIIREWSGKPLYQKFLWSPKGIVKEYAKVIEDPEAAALFGQLITTIKAMWDLNRMAEWTDDEWNANRAMIEMSWPLVGFYNYPIRSDFLSETTLGLMKDYDEDWWVPRVIYSTLAAWLESSKFAFLWPIKSVGTAMLQGNWYDSNMIKKDGFFKEFGGMVLMALMQGTSFTNKWIIPWTRDPSVGYSYGVPVKDTMAYNNPWTYLLTAISGNRHISRVATEREIIRQKKEYADITEKWNWNFLISLAAKIPDIFSVANEYGSVPNVVIGDRYNDYLITDKGHSLLMEKRIGEAVDWGFIDVDDLEAYVRTFDNPNEMTFLGMANWKLDMEYLREYADKFNYGIQKQWSDPKAFRALVKNYQNAMFIEFSDKVGSKQIAYKMAVKKTVTDWIKAIRELNDWLSLPPWTEEELRKNMYTSLAYVFDEFIDSREASDLSTSRFFTINFTPSIKETATGYEETKKYRGRIERILQLSTLGEMYTLAWEWEKDDIFNRTSVTVSDIVNNIAKGEWYVENAAIAIRDLYRIITKQKTITWEEKKIIKAAWVNAMFPVLEDFMTVETGKQLLEDNAPLIMDLANFIYDWTSSLIDLVEMDWLGKWWWGGWGGGRVSTKSAFSVPKLKKLQQEAIIMRKFIQANYWIDFSSWFNIKTVPVWIVPAISKLQVEKPYVKSETNRDSWKYLIEQTARAIWGRTSIIKETKYKPTSKPKWVKSKRVKKPKR